MCNHEEPSPTLSACAPLTDPRYVTAAGLKAKDAWLALKEAQGHPISREALARLTPAHLTGTTLAPAAQGVDLASADPHVAEQIEPHRRAALAKIRTMIARGTGPSGGDAA